MKKEENEKPKISAKDINKMIKEKIDEMNLEYDKKMEQKEHRKFLRS